MAKREWLNRWKDRLKEKLIRFNRSDDRQQLDEWLMNIKINAKFEERDEYARFEFDANEEVGSTRSPVFLTSKT